MTNSRIVPLAEFCLIRRGETITKAQTQPGDVPVIAGGQKPAYFHSHANRPAGTVVVAGSGAYAGFVSYWNDPVWVSDAFSVEPNPDLAIPKFVFYLLKNSQEQIHALKSGGGVPHVYGKDVGKLEFLLPSLDEQHELVNKLDAFTMLEAELEAELEARRKQYEFYRNRLLTFAPDQGGGTARDAC